MQGFPLIDFKMAEFLEKYLILLFAWANFTNLWRAACTDGQDELNRLMVSITDWLYATESAMKKINMFFISFFRAQKWSEHPGFARMQRMENLWSVCMKIVELYMKLSEEELRSQVWLMIDL